MHTGIETGRDMHKSVSGAMSAAVCEFYPSQTTITGGNVIATSKSNGCGIYNLAEGYSQEVTILGGNISGGKYGIYNESDSYGHNATVNIGNSQAQLSQENPNISGGEYGIYNLGTWNFYNGIVKGTIAGYNSDPTAQREKTGIKTGTETISETLYNTAYLGNSVYSIITNNETNYYTTLAEACEGAKNGDTIKVIENTTDTAEVEIQDKNIILDLQSHTITREFAHIYINEGGILSIEGNGEITSSIATITIYEGGILNVGSQDIALDRQSPVISGYAAIRSFNGIWNFYNGTLQEETMLYDTEPAEIREGYEVITDEGVKYLSNSTEFKITPDNGTIAVGEVTEAAISGLNLGELTATSDDELVATATLQGNTLLVTGVGEGIAGITIKESNQDKEVYFDVRVTGANYYIQKENETMYYGVLSSAISGAENGDTITVMNYVEEDQATIISNKDITIDLQNNEIQSEIYVNQGGVLTIKGNGRLTNPISVIKISEGGIVNIQEGTVFSTDYYDEESSNHVSAGYSIICSSSEENFPAVLNITGGNISGIKSDGEYSAINVLGGIVEGDGIYNNKGTINIGSNSQEFNRRNPIVYGLYCNNNKGVIVNIDTNNDGMPDINIDTDGDEIADINIDTDGDGIADINIDTNGDELPDTNINTSYVNNIKESLRATKIWNFLMEL